ncbi:FxSxx-COOH system tetratricopeptide repeat protein [Streptomyces sp. NPDC002004]
MDGFPRERAPDQSQAADESYPDDPGWREIADAAWLASARLAGGRGRLPDGDPELPASGSGPPPPLPPELPEPDGPAPGVVPAAPRGDTPSDEYRDLTAVPVHAGNGAGGDGETVVNGVFGTPGSSGHQQAPLAKALHRLGRRLPSLRAAELDEERTAQHGLSDNLWIPYLRPAQEKAFDLVVLADDAPTMRVWDGAVDRIALDAERSGAFRDVRTVRLELPRAGRAELRWAGGRTGDPAELVDGRGSRIFLVATDGLAHGWAARPADDLLARLAGNGPTALVHLLPTYLWHRTSLHPHRALLDAGGFGAPNRRVAHRPPPGGDDPLRPHPGTEEREAAPAGARARTAQGAGRRRRARPEDPAPVTARPREPLPVPVLSLKPESFTAWAELVTGDRGVSRVLPMVAVGSRERAVPAAGLRAPRVPDARAAAAAVRRFVALATPVARRLAAHLAAVPFEFDVIEELAGRAVPEAGPAHIAEIMMGGLIDWNGDGEGRPDFAEGIREALLATTTRSQLARTVSLFAGLRSGGERGDRLRAALWDPEGTALPDESAGTAWLRIEKAVLKALAGPYARRAARMNQGTRVNRRDDIRPDPEIVGSVSRQRSPGAEVPSPYQEPELVSVPETSETAPSLVARKADPSMDLTSTDPRTLRTGQPKIMGNVPPKNADFTGREDLLADVEEQLRRDETAAVLPHALHGMGGVGKSQIAIEYVYRHRHEYNVIWWIPAEQESLILGALADLARSLNLEVGPQANTAVPAVREALRTGKPYDNWLLVFDNAEDIDVVRSYFPTGGPGKILVTSRNRDWERVAVPLTVSVFQREESIALLQRRARDLSDEDADQLADALGDLPLAIEQAGSWHAATGMPVAEYLQLLAERRPGILELDPSPDYPVSVAAAWNISLERLAQTNPAARQLLEICACMAPEPIPLGMLRGSRNVEITPELDPVLRDPVRLARATRDLTKLSLIRVDHKNGTLQMHRLMQTVLTAGLDEEEAARMRRAGHVLLATAKPGAPEAPDQWPAYQALLPHVLASEAVRSADPWVRELVNNVVLYLYYWGAHEAGVSLAREAWTAWHAHSGEEDVKVLQMQKLLAFMLRLTGQDTAEALSLNETALEVSRRESIPDEELIESMVQMGGALRHKGDFYGARALNEEADHRARDLFGPEDPATLLAAHDYGVSLRMCGDFAAARELDEETVRQWELLYGPTNGLTLNTLNGLAIDIREGGDYPSARVLQEETYQTYRNYFGEDNAATIRAARNLAVCRRRDGSLEEASALTEETLDRFTVRYGSQYPDTLATAMNAMVDRRLRGDLANSRSLGEKTLERYRLTLGDDHAYTLSTMVNLAATLRSQGDVDGAEALDTRTAQRLHATLGPRHVTTLTAALGMANNHYARLDFGGARVIDEATLPKMTEAAGADHPLTLSCRANLALDLRGLGDIAQADRLNAEVVEAFSRVVGDGHPWLSAARLHQRIECDIAPMPL